MGHLFNFSGISSFVSCSLALPMIYPKAQLNMVGAPRVVSLALLGSILILQTKSMALQSIKICYQVSAAAIS